MMKCFLVMGTPRSGTSCVSGILHRMGIRMALGDFVPPGPANPTGFYEDHALNDCIGSVEPERELYLHEKHAIRSRLKKVINDRETSLVDWGAKTYRLSFVIEDWIALSSSDVKMIFTQRNLDSSKESWKSAFGGSGRIIDLVESKLSNRRAGGFSVHYDSLIENPEREVRRIAQYVGRSDFEQGIQDSIAFVDVTLKRF